MVLLRHKVKSILSIQLGIGMDEPVKKKLRVDRNEIINELEILQEHLLKHCLCKLLENSLQSIWIGFQMIHPTAPRNCSLNWTDDELLMLTSSVQLICDIALKQYTRRLICNKIASLCEALSRNESNVIDCLVDLANHPNRFVCFASSHALSSIFMIIKSHVEQHWLDTLADNIISVPADQCNNMSFSLGVIKRIIEWKEVDEHTLESTVENQPLNPPSCHTLIIPEDVEDMDNMQVKGLCIKSLESRWPAIVNRFDDLISSTDCSTYHAEIITFLNLWETIISVKANLSVIDTKAFYSNLNSFISLLSSNVPPLIWRHMLNFFNEVLCYGSTLALQDILAEEPCSLATLIVRSVKDSRFLNSVPYREGSGRFGGGIGDGDKPLLQKLVLLVLKAVAITVKETRCDSSSDSSLGSEAEDVDADMAVIERSIHEVLKQLDGFVKTLLPFHPETILAQWVVQLFSDQDDALIESMVCCLDVSTGLCYRDTAIPDLRHILNPVVTFVQFLHTVSFDYDVLLDFLVSNETCFLLYLLRLLKFVCRNWQEFLGTCGRNIDDTMSILIRLRLSIERLVSKDLFPYNINPVLRLLSKCEHLYENNL